VEYRMCIWIRLFCDIRNIYCHNNSSDRFHRFKGIVPASITHPHVIPNLYDFLSNVEHKVIF